MPNRSTPARSGPFEPPRLVALVTATLLAVASAPALAQTESARVARDPVTGQLRALTKEEARALQAKAQQSAAAAAKKNGVLSGAPVAGPVRRADGSVELELDESTLSHTVMKRAADGTLSTHCVTGPTAVQALLGAKSATLAQSTAAHNHLEHKHGTR